MKNRFPLSVWNFPNVCPSIRSALLGALLAVSLLPSTAPAQNPVIIQKKLQSWEVPEVRLNSVTLAEAVTYLAQRSKALDPEKKGLNFLLLLPPDHPTRKTPITLELSNVPLGAVVDYVTRQAGLIYRVDNFAVIIEEPAKIPKAD